LKEGGVRHGAPKKVGEAGSQFMITQEFELIACGRFLDTEEEVRGNEDALEHELDSFLEGIAPFCGPVVEGKVALRFT